jgi:chromosomal replication initiator protein
VAIYLIRSLTMTSFKKIGGLFGNRDHSTIMHAHRKLETIMSKGSGDNDQAIRQTVQQLKQELAEQML